MNITKDVRYIGVDDKTIDLFESQYTVPNGISYNSYVILDEKVCVMDTVDARFTDEWMENLLFRDMLSRLAPEEKQLLHLRYVEGKKQKEAAEILHTSQSGVSRMENHLMKSLHRMWAE